MPQSFDEAISYSNRWLDIIKTPVVNEEQGKQIIDESLFNCNYSAGLTRPAAL